MRQSCCFLVLLICMVVASCGPHVDEDGYVLIDTEDDPELLPYRFVEIDERRYDVFPLDLGSDKAGIYEIQNNWRPEEPTSGIVFGYYPGVTENQGNHYTAHTKAFLSNLAYDFDNDGVQEVAVTYVSKDTLWLAILEAFGDHRYSAKPLVAGIDRNGNGRWEGEGSLCAVNDLNQDGYVELLVNCFGDYDHYPRSMICVDWRRDTLLWSFDVAGAISAPYTWVVPADSVSETTIVFGVSAPCNGVVANGMMDCYSYLVCLDIHGSLKWHKAIGPRYSRCLPHVLDYDTNGRGDILTNFTYGASEDSLCSGLLVYDLGGNLLDSLEFSKGISRIANLSPASTITEKLMVSFRDNTLRMYSPDLQQAESYKFNKILHFGEYADFVGDSTRELLTRSSDLAVWLFDSSFRPLAVLPEGGEPGLMTTSDGGRVIIVRREGWSHLYTLQENQWLLVFVKRNEDYLLTLLGFVTAALIFTVYYQRRTKRNLTVIVQQNEELEKLHRELEKAQAKIVAQEKYRQAKDVAGGVAHEINNALNPAVHALHNLRKRLGLTAAADLDRNQDLVKMGQDAVSRGLRMADLVKMYASLESAKREDSVNLQELFADVIHANRLRLDEMNVLCGVEVADDLAVTGNQTHLYSVFNNLLLNSLDAFDGSGSRSIAVSAKLISNTIHIEFTDTGKGIPEDALTRIFDMFFSTKPATGTGIGLSMAAKIVDLYDGTISVSSTVGAGTTFAITLPAELRT